MLLHVVVVCDGLFGVVRCLRFVVCGWLLAFVFVCWLLFECCWLFLMFEVVGCLMFNVYGSLFVASCSLSGMCLGCCV